MNTSNRNGRALEMAYLLTFIEIGKLNNVKIEITKNSSFNAAKTAWDNISTDMQNIFLLSATAGIKVILDTEPLILDGTDTLELKIQSDNAGKEGDVRDIVITRKQISWEIGLSVKNNHFAVKHSRLSNKLDFGEKWFGVKCSEKYWVEIAPIFAYLQECKRQQANWSELPSKENDVYIPILTAFLAEINRSYAAHGEILPTNMVEYLIGKYDFYKTIGLNKKRLTQIQPYNLRGLLNKPSNSRNPSIIIPRIALPKRIIAADFKPNSSTTVEIFMDEGWQFSFRIHNASTKVETSLKFDIQIIGMPTTIICIDYNWD